MRNEPQRLGGVDSDGRKVYINPSEKTNPHQQWVFEPTNYELTTVVMDFDLNYDDDI